MSRTPLLDAVIPGAGTLALLSTLGLFASPTSPGQDGRAITLRTPELGQVVIPTDDGIAKKTGQVIQMNFRNFPVADETPQWFRRTPGEGSVRLRIDLFDRSGAAVAPGVFALESTPGKQAVIHIVDHFSASLLTIRPNSKGYVRVTEIDAEGITGTVSFESTNASVNGSFYAKF